MSEFISAVLAVLAPLYFLFIPGLVLPGPSRQFASSSTVINILLLLAAALLHWPLFIPVLLNLIMTVCLLFFRRSQFNLGYWWTRLPTILIFLTLYFVFSIPYLFMHDGLPTGDSQKAIIWAEQMRQQSSLPNYSQAVAWLNRDRTDFFTPGLHALIAGVSLLSPQPLLSVGLLSIALSISVALLGGMLAAELIDQPHWAVRPLTVILILTNARFLRYLREPGYHLQNVLGELLLFALLWLAIRIIHRGRQPLDAVLAALTAIALVLSHQFSAFLAPFLLLPAIVLIIRRYPRYLLGLAVLLILGWLVFRRASLISKLPHLFTSHPHLLHLTPTLTDYPALLSLSFLLAGIVGWLYLLKQRTAPTAGFVAGAILLLGLSQAPRFGLDIPPVRALFYSIVPLGIGAAVAISALRLRPLVLIALLLAMTLPAVSSAYSLTHDVRTNSTLLPEQLTLANIIKQRWSDQREAVLIDDYNRRSASWLVLAGHSMFTRLAADIVTQQNEARQSPLRRTLYLNQLDFEKIFSLGSQPEISSLLTKHSIRWLTGIDKSSATAFSHNPSLQLTAYGRDEMLFEKKNRSQTVTDTPLINWLLKPSTLANDIGDEEDEFKHLPLSLRAPNLSEPQANGSLTFRTTTAPLVPITANVRDYVAVLWDQDKNNQPDGAAQLLVRFQTNPGPLTITTSTGHRFTLRHNQPLRLPPDSLSLTDGVISLLLENPARQALAIDLLALGLAPTP